MGWLGLSIEVCHKCEPFPSKVAIRNCLGRLVSRTPDFVEAPLHKEIPSPQVLHSYKYYSVGSSHCLPETIQILVGTFAVHPTSVGLNHSCKVEIVFESSAKGLFGIRNVELVEDSAYLVSSLLIKSLASVNCSEQTTNNHANRRSSNQEACAPPLKRERLIMCIVHAHKATMAKVSALLLERPQAHVKQVALFVPFPCS